MDIEEYIDLLKEKEWKEKRETILKRDDYTCQKCGKRGFSYRAFIFSGYSEIDELMNGCSIDGQSVSTFLKSIEWKDKTYIPMQHFESKHVSGKRFIISFKDNADERSFMFAANDYPLHPSYIKYENIGLKMWLKDIGREFHVDFYAFKLNENYGTNNYIITSRENGDISIYLKGKLFCFRANKYSLFRYWAMDFATLNVHHKLYIENKMPWQYDDEVFTTLCSDCHAEVHKTETTPLLSESGRVIYSDLPICDRCGGSGYLDEYYYYMNGICFKCCGRGVLLNEV